MSTWDTIGVILAQNLYVLNNIGGLIKPGKITIGTIIVFLTISYISGRYNNVSERGHGAIAGKALVAIAISTGIIAMASWLSNRQIELLLRGPVVELMLITATWSIFGQWLMRTRITGSKSWLVACSDEEWEELQQIGESGSINLVKVRTADDISKGQGKKKGISVAISAKGLIDAEMVTVLDELKTRGATIRNIRWLAETHLQAIPSRMVDKVWLVSSEGFGVVPGTTRWRLKRVVDIVVASTLLIGTAPIAAAAMVAVFIEDRKSPLYKQERTGLYGKPFTIWKIRSMKSNAESEGARWSTGNDTRITNTGKLLRATRIDELPQLVNVLKGEMSMVGPRPERPEFDEGFYKEIENYRYRYNALPGLTGWSQVCFRYGASKRDTETKLAYDMYYLKNASFLLDCLVLLKTVRLVLSARGYRAMESK